MELGLDVFMMQVFEAMSAFGGLSFMMKISSVSLLLVASMKVSILKPYWDKLGLFKVFAAPVLSLFIGVIDLSAQGIFTFSSLGAYLVSGSGAIILHQMLDAVKESNKVGGYYIKLIDFLQSFLKKKQ